MNAFLEMNSKNTNLTKNVAKILVAQAVVFSSVTGEFKDIDWLLDFHCSFV